MARKSGRGSDNPPPGPPAVKTIERRQFISGPIPSPEVFQRYDEILPGPAERILGMAESDAEHRRWLERTALTGEIRTERTGQVLGFLVAAGAISAAVYLAVLGHPALGASLIGAELAVLVGAFVYVRRRR